MYGVDGPFVGPTNPIRGIPGDELPWEVAHFVRGGLTTNGQLTIIVPMSTATLKPRSVSSVQTTTEYARYTAIVELAIENFVPMTGIYGESPSIVATTGVE